MAETTKPKFQQNLKKAQGLELVNNDQIETVNFEAFRIHFFTSLSHYRFIIFGGKDSIVGSSVFGRLYELVINMFLKDPEYDDVVSLLTLGTFPPAHIRLV